MNPERGFRSFYGDPPAPNQTEPCVIVTRSNLRWMLGSYIDEATTEDTSLSNAN